MSATTKKRKNDTDQKEEPQKHPKLAADNNTPTVTSVDFDRLLQAEYRVNPVLQEDANQRIALEDERDKELKQLAIQKFAIENKYNAQIEDINQKHTAEKEVRNDVEQAQEFLDALIELEENKNATQQCILVPMAPHDKCLLNPLTRRAINELWGGYIPIQAYYKMSTVREFGCYTPDWPKVKWELDDEYYGCEQEDAVVMYETYLIVNKQNIPSELCLDPHQTSFTFQTEEPTTAEIAQAIEKGLEPDSDYQHKIGTFFKVDYPVACFLLTRAPCKKEIPVSS